MDLKSAILLAVATIPFGKVAYYGQIASLCGCPTYSRYVGTLLKNLPADTHLPWHRVVNRKGEISFPQGSGGHSRQVALLADEGVAVNNGKISLHIYGWSI